MLSDGVIGLRAVEPDDTDALYLWENESVQLMCGGIRAPLSRHQIWTYANNYDSNPLSSGELRLMVVDCERGERLGCVDLTDIDVHNGRAQVGIYVKASVRGRGIGRRSLGLLAGYAKECLGLHQLWAVVARDNSSSLKLFESCGFKSCGLLRSWIKKGQSFTDALVYQFMLDQALKKF